MTIKELQQAVFDSCGILVDDESSCLPRKSDNNDILFNLVWFKAEYDEPDYVRAFTFYKKDNKHIKYNEYYIFLTDSNGDKHRISLLIKKYFGRD